MAMYPGAISKPITASKGRQRLMLFNRVNAHVAVSEADSVHGFFNRTGQVDSHFYIRRDGTVEQYVDTDWRAFADLDGNDATISVETQGGVTNADSEPWTPEQVEALAQLYAWAVTTHGIERKIATSSHLGERSRGLSWHRLGIDGNFPDLPDVGAGRTQRGGGMHYSRVRGKLCPGAGKIAQIQGIFDRAMGILDGDSGASAPAPAPAPAPVATNPAGRPLLKVDGFLGSHTITEWQHVMGTPVDGVISTGPRGSALVIAVQTALVAAGHSVGASGIDGHGIVPNTAVRTRRTDTHAGLQAYLGTPVDGVLDSPSTAVRTLQERLNAGTF